MIRQNGDSDGQIAWPQYLTHFEAVANLNGWNACDKAQYLSVSLRGEACQVLQLLEPMMTSNYQMLIEALNRRFGPILCERLYRMQLRTTVRGPKQPLPQLAQSIKVLASQAYPSADKHLLDSLCCDHFIEALHDDDMKMMLMNSNIDSFDDIVARAVKYEALCQVSKIKTGKRVAYSVDADKSTVMESNNTQSNADCSVLQSKCVRLSDEMNIIKRKLKQLQDQLNGFTKQIDDKKHIWCYFCHQQGHIKPKCPKLAEKRRNSSVVI